MGPNRQNFLIPASISCCTVLCMNNDLLFKDPKVLADVPQVKDVRTPIVLDGLNCRSTEANLGQCHHRPIVEYCSHSDDAGAFCVRGEGILNVHK